MLQPLQLKEVSARYVEEVAELRDFLVKAGCVTGTANSLHGIAGRLLQDRAFRRDLTSHVWVVIDRCHWQISYSDLLGIVAIAGAGINFAAVAAEDDAHSLLRFLMDARRSLDMAPHGRDGANLDCNAQPITDATVEVVQSKSISEGSFPHRQIPVAPEVLKSEPMLGEVSSSRERVQWLVAAMCLVLALSIGLWLKLRSTSDVALRSVTVVPVVEGDAASNAVVERSGNRSPDRPSESATASIVPTDPTRRTAPPIPAALSIPPRASSTVPVAVGAISHGSISTPFAPPVETAVPRALSAAGIASTTVASPQSAASKVRLGVAPATADASDKGRDLPDVRTSKATVLLRRRVPGSASESEGETGLVSEVRPMDVRGSIGTASTASSDTTRSGVVHLTSLGSMASNLMYSPVPIYPSAASASRVQGEVKVSAEVDRDGNVASVRVISGPPLLRDAALDAVQRWRYRPYISSGGAIPMTAVTILDFQLP